MGVTNPCIIAKGKILFNNKADCSIFVSNKPKIEIEIQPSRIDKLETARLIEKKVFE